MNRKQEALDLHALYQEAVLLHQQGQPEEAISRYVLIVDHINDFAEVHYNLGLAYFETGRFSLAVASCSRAAELCPADADIFYNLGLACKMDNRYAEAERAYLQALALAPADRDIRYNLGCCYRDAGELEPARNVFAELAAQAPDHLPTLNNLAYLHHLLGEYDEARAAYGNILRLDANHASARFMQAVLVGTPVAVPPQDYIRSLFDHYSETFEENLTLDLEYTLYLDLRVMYDALPQKKRLRTHGLDLGCGTGLTGEAFRTACQRMSGIDLSAKMIEQAGRKQIYDALHVEEIVTFLHTTPEKYDLFIAADVLIYRGDLQPLFAAAARRATADALFCLSTEKTEAGEWILQPNGRYAHHPDYVRKTAGQNGWVELRSGGTDIRREGDSWIDGSLFIFARKILN